ncbi:hypothetical protein D3C71_1597020 [compost metagenome]
MVARTVSGCSVLYLRHASPQNAPSSSARQLHSRDGSVDCGSLRYVHRRINQTDVVYTPHLPAACDCNGLFVHRDASCNEPPRLPSCTRSSVRRRVYFDADLYCPDANRKFHIGSRSGAGAASSDSGARRLFRLYPLLL